MTFCRFVEKTYLCSKKHVILITLHRWDEELHLIIYI